MLNKDKKRTGVGRLRSGQVGPGVRMDRTVANKLKKTKHSVHS